MQGFENYIVKPAELERDLFDDTNGHSNHMKQ